MELSSYSKVHLQDLMVQQLQKLLSVCPGMARPAVYADITGMNLEPVYIEQRKHKQPFTNP